MPDNKVASQRGPAALSVDLSNERLKKRQILLGHKLKVSQVVRGQTDEDYLLSDNSLQGSQSPTSTLSPEGNSKQGPNNNMMEKEEKGALTLEQFTDIVLAQEGIDPGRVANNSEKCLQDSSRQVILPSVRGSQRFQGEKLKPVVLTPRSVAAPQAVCPPALLTHRLMSQGREEERRRLDEERRKLEEEKRREEERRGRGENSRRQEKGCRDERPLYESIYSLAGSPGGICPPTKSTLDQLHPLQLQLLSVHGADLALNEQIKRQIELALLRNEHVLGSSAPPVDLGRRRQAAKAAPLRVRARGRSPGGQTEGSRPLNLSVREEEPLFQFVKKAPQLQAMPKEANEALLNLIAKTGRDLEITRKTRKAGELDSSQRLRRENLESSLNFSPIAPQVAVTPVFPGKHQKRRLVEEDKEAKKVKKEEDNIHIIFAKNHAKEEEQREGKEMESLRSKQCDVKKEVTKSPEINRAAMRNGQRSPKLPNGSSPTNADGKPGSPSRQSSSPPKSKMIPITSLKKEGDRFESNQFVTEMREAAMSDLKLATVPDINGNCPIHVAVMLRNLRLVQRFSIVLKALGHTVDVTNRQDETALHLAVANGDEAIVDVLSRRGADPCKPSATGDSGIHMAVKGGHSGCLRMLLKRNPGRREVDHCNDQGLTPLHLAVVHGEDSMLKQLLAYGAKPDLQEMTGGKTPMFLAVERGAQETIETLICYGASVSFPNFSGVTPLSLCSENRRLVAMMNQFKPIASHLSRTGNDTLRANQVSTDVEEDDKSRDTSIKADLSNNHTTSANVTDSCKADATKKISGPSKNDAAPTRKSTRVEDANTDDIVNCSASVDNIASTTTICAS